MVLTTVEGGTLFGTTVPYAAGVNYGAGVNRAGRVAPMQAGISAGGANYGAGASRAAGMQQTTPGVYGASGPYVAGVAGLAGWSAPAAGGLANFGSSKIVDGGVDVDEGLAAGRLTGGPLTGGVTRELGSTAKAGYSGMNAQYPAATFAGQTAQIGSPVAWKAIAPAMDAANPRF